MIEQLKALVLNGGYDDEIKQRVLQLDERLHQLSVNEKILQHQPVKEWFDYLGKQIEQANLLLSEDSTLTELQRSELFIRKEIARKYITLLDSDKSNVEQTIKSLLDDFRDS